MRGRLLVAFLGCCGSLSFQVPVARGVATRDLGIAAGEDRLDVVALFAPPSLIAAAERRWRERRDDGYPDTPARLRCFAFEPSWPLARKLACARAAADALTPRLAVVFGRPGSGKSTVLAAAALSGVVALDGDACVPQGMRDNFARGVYPTLEERAVFADSLCTTTREAIAANAPLSIVLAFSFVNDDLRGAFRAAFPEALWVLVDTAERDADARVATRDGHFYNPPDRADQADDEWAFAPVRFDHARLDGARPVVESAALLRRLLALPVLVLDLEAHGLALATELEQLALRVLDLKAAPGKLGDLLGEPRSGTLQREPPVSALAAGTNSLLGGA